MKRRLIHSLFPIFLIFSLVSCNDDDVTPGDLSVFDNGVFIINEGNFTDSDGSLSFFDPDSLSVKQKVFESINNRPFAGLFQSLIFYQDRGYLVDQAGRIEVVNEKDLFSVSAITENLVLPRYFAGHDNKGYVTDWGPYDENFSNKESKVKVFNLDNLAMTGELVTASRPEDILILNGKVYVANSGANVVSVYSTSDNQLIKELETGYGPTRFVPDKNNNIWVICTGAYITTGSLVGIDTGSDQILSTLELSAYAPNGRVAIDDAGETIYFMSEQWASDFSYTETVIYRVKLSLEGIAPGFGEGPERFLEGRNWYGLGMDKDQEIIYVADAVALQGNGTVYRYDLDGELVDSFSVGRGPRDFVFRRQ